MDFTEIMSKNVPIFQKETEFALAALMEIPSQYKATLDFQLLRYQQHLLQFSAFFFENSSMLMLFLLNRFLMPGSNQRNTIRRKALPPPIQNSRTTHSSWNYMQSNNIMQTDRMYYTPQPPSTQNILPNRVNF